MCRKEVIKEPKDDAKEQENIRPRKLKGGASCFLSHFYSKKLAMNFFI